ncbi:MAG: DUF6379 domain-containing protein [Eubacteriales bacterium]|nr:DUF6379 domain-containing protein [Eubacteriales bacterium]
MFDNNVFIEGSCRNVEQSGELIGYELGTYITYYRGIPLSMVNDIGVKEDGESVPREAIRCSVDQGEYWFTLDEMETVSSYAHKWEYGEPMTVRVLKKGGLSKGTHQIVLTVNVRTAYIPVPLEGSKERTVEI